MLQRLIDVTSVADKLQDIKAKRWFRWHQKCFGYHFSQFFSVIFIRIFYTLILDTRYFSLNYYFLQNTTLICCYNSWVFNLHMWDLQLSCRNYGFKLFNCLLFLRTVKFSFCIKWWCKFFSQVTNKNSKHNVLKCGYYVKCWT